MFTQRHEAQDNAKTINLSCESCKAIVIQSENIKMESWRCELWLHFTYIVIYSNQAFSSSFQARWNAKNGKSLFT